MMPAERPAEGLLLNISSIKAGFCLFLVESQCLTHGRCLIKKNKNVKL